MANNTPYFLPNEWAPAHFLRHFAVRTKVTLELGFEVFVYESHDYQHSWDVVPNSIDCFECTDEALQALGLTRHDVMLDFGLSLAEKLTETGHSVSRKFTWETEPSGSIQGNDVPRPPNRPVLSARAHLDRFLAV